MALTKKQLECYQALLNLTKALEMTYIQNLKKSNFIVLYFMVLRFREFTSLLELLNNHKVVINILNKLNINPAENFEGFINDVCKLMLDDDLKFQLESLRDTYNHQSSLLIWGTIMLFLMILALIITFTIFFPELLGVGGLIGIILFAAPIFTFLLTYKNLNLELKHLNSYMKFFESQDFIDCSPAESNYDPNLINNEFDSKKFQPISKATMHTMFFKDEDLVKSVKTKFSELKRVPS
jgi:hypothetical protein